MYQDINGKTGNSNMQGNDVLYGSLTTMAASGDFSFLDNGIKEIADYVKPLPTDEEALVKLKEDKISYLSACAQYAGQMPFKATVGGVEYDYDADGGSRELMTGAVTRVNSGWIPPENWFWKTLDNQRPITTAEDLIVISEAMSVVVETAWGTNDYMKEQVRAATTMEQVEAIWWPWPDGVDPRSILE